MNPFDSIRFKRFASVCFLLFSGMLPLLTRTQVHAAEDRPILKNGDFEAGFAGWIGDRRVETIDGNKVAALPLKHSVRQSFHQKFRIRKMKQLKLTFRVKASDDFDGKGFTLSIAREDDGSTYRNFGIDKKAGSEWKEMNWEYNVRDGDDELDLVLEVRPGSGTLYFDDFVLKGE